MSLEDIFERFSRSRIFRKREILLPDHVPDKLPHRDRQIRALGSIVAPALSGSRPSNVFIYGLTGTGKTAVARYVLTRLEAKGGGKVVYSYVNCRHSDTSYRVLAELARSVGKNVPFTGLSTSEVFSRFMRGLEARGVIMIAVLDEIDYLVKRNGDDVLYHLTRVNTRLTRSRLSVIGITNDLRFMEFLDARVKSSLGEEELVFPPYNSRELEDILEMRAREAFNPGVLEDGVIQLCAAIAARQNGDARLALDLLLKAADIAERMGEERVGVEHVKMAQREIEKNLTVDVVRSAPLHVKLVILAIYVLEKSGRSSMITGEIYDTYSRLARGLGIEPVTQRRVSEIINELDMTGIINAQIVSMGRYGRTKKIKLSVSRNILREGLKENPTLEHVIEEKMVNMIHL